MEVKALQQILTQCRQMQENLQKQVENVHVEASAGGGMVTVRMNGQKQLTEIRIDPEIFAGRAHEPDEKPYGRDSGHSRTENPRPVLGAAFYPIVEADTPSEIDSSGPPH